MTANIGHLPLSIEGIDGITVSQTGAHLKIGGSGVVSQFGRVYYTELETDETIGAHAPDPPFTVVLVELMSLTWTSETGRAILSSSFNGGIQWDEATEIDPTLVLTLRLDGVDIQAGIAGFDINSAPSNLQTASSESTLISVREVAPDVSHTIQLMWAVTGSEPEVDVFCFAAAGGFNHATLLVQEIPLL